MDLTTSGVGGEHEFYLVTGATRFADGAIAVADRGSGQIRFYSADGRFDTAFGRPGRGPGEFTRLSQLHRLGADSAMAFDRAANRVTIVERGGRGSRVLQLPLRVRDVQPLGDAWLVAMVEAIVPDTMFAHPGIVRRPAPVVRIRRDGLDIDTIATAAGVEEAILTGPPGPGLAFPLLGKTSIMRAVGHSFILGSADYLGFRIYSAEGHLELITRVPSFDLELTTADLDREREAWMDFNPSETVRQLTDVLPEPETRPAYGQLLVDALGYVWAGAHHGWASRDAPTEWQVFAPSGGWMGRVATPEAFEVFEIGVDYVLGVSRDAMNVEHVQVLSLERPHTGVAR
jgi:hypothetical protein